MKEVDIEFENYYLIGGYRFPEKMVDEANNQPFPFLGRIEPDPLIMDYNIEGKSLFKLPEDNPTYKSIKKIMKKAGY
jgi:CO dehydrogenase nickel-insertion accessory protein CooC1